MRLFIAVLLENNMTEALLSAQDALRSRHYSGGFTGKNDLHLTLSFIGEYSDPDAVLEQMELIPFAPFPLTLSGCIGNFGDLLWAGLERAPELEKYAKQLRRRLAERRIPFDKKSFHPHITLLRRAASTQPFSDIVIKKETMTVRRISLMRSDLGKHGARYTEIGFAECTERSRL